MLEDYDRYLAPYYQAWMLAMLCLLANGARQWAGPGAGRRCG